MDKANIELAQLLISKSYVQQGVQSLQQRQNLTKDLLSQRKLPKDGWDDESINFLISELSLMDSNNFISNIGMGEREGRVFSKLVKTRNYSLSHGIGRSGELFAEQPKAAGSSILVKLAHFLALDSLKLSGMKVSGCLIVPCATGMTLSLTLMTLLQKNPTAKYVVWPRIDQKTCLKCIITAGLTPIVIPNVLENDELRTDLVTMENVIKEKQKDILCVLSTTSCFAPRAPDKIVEISKLCKTYSVGHVINNAYGVQCYNYSKLINDALNKGRVDAIVQSTDKNYMVPVGGAIIASNDKDLLNDISQLYPGRASVSPILDLFITLLSLGSSGFSNLLNSRQELMSYLHSKLSDFATKHNERLLDTSNNPISLAMTLSNIPREHVSYLGSMLFSRFISGTRINVPYSKKTICNILFNGYGTHFDNYPHPYLNVACAIGIQQDEIDLFLEKLNKVFVSFYKYIKEKESKKDNKEEEIVTTSTEKEENNKNTKTVSL